MTRRQIKRFFKAFARRVDQPATVLLTGAAAGSLMGSSRPSLDVDFEVVLSPRSQRRWEAIEQAVAEASQETGIAAQFGEEIGRWSLISLLDYARHTRPYQRFGTVEVRLLEPAYWAIGKLARYLDPDVRDLVQVLRRQRLAPEPLARLWGRALRESPRSTACWAFRRQVEHFLATHGRAIWGPSFDAAAAIAAFHRAAGIAV